MVLFVMFNQNAHDRIKILTSFGSAVRDLRLKQGFSQEGFADHCGLDRTYIGGVERAERLVKWLKSSAIAPSSRYWFIKLC